MADSLFTQNLTVPATLNLVGEVVELELLDAHNNPVKTVGINIHAVANDNRGEPLELAAVEYDPTKPENFTPESVAAQVDYQFRSVDGLKHVDVNREALAPVISGLVQRALRFYQSLQPTAIDRLVQ